MNFFRKTFSNSRYNINQRNSTSSSKLYQNNMKLRKTSGSYSLLFTGISRACEKPQQNTLTRHSSFAPLCQIDEWMVKRSSFSIFRHKKFRCIMIYLCTPKWGARFHLIGIYVKWRGFLICYQIVLTSTFNFQHTLTKLENSP